MSLDLPPKKFWLTVLALFVGAALLIIGGSGGDAVTQTAGATVIAAVLAVLGYQRATNPKP